MFKKHVFRRQAQCFLKFLQFEPEMFLINFGSHHHLKMATYSVHSFVYCFFFFFQISCKLNLFSCRDSVYSLSRILSVCFNVKKPLGVKAFIDLIRLDLLFFSILKLVLLKKTKTKTCRQ